MAEGTPRKLGFIAELRRRQVLRVLGFYAIAVWLTWQIADVVLEPLNAPDWIMTALIIALALGFPIVAVLAWAFDITPSGLVRTGAPGDADLPVEGLDDLVSARPRVWADIIVIGVLLAIVAYLVTQSTTDFPTGTDAPSIAVLPFTDLSAQQDQGHFTAGLTEALIERLVSDTALQVVARASTFADSDVRAIGERLGATAVLKGGVRRDGQRVKISAQLVDVESGMHVWSESYDRLFVDILDVQDDIARAIARAMRVQFLLTNDADRGYDTDAYDLYLRGRGALQQNWTRANIEQAVTYFTDALRIDPKLALADAGLCRAYLELDDLTKEAGYIERATEACHAARTRTDVLPDVHVALGRLYERTGRHELAVSHYQRALALDAGSVEALRGIGVLQGRNGDVAAAEATLRRVVQLEPDYWRGYASLGYLQYSLGRFDEAAEAFARGVERNPYNPHLLNNLGGVYLQLRRIEDAKTYFMRSIDAYPTASAYSNLGTLQYLTGDYGPARETFREVVAMVPGSYEYRMFLADLCRLTDQSECAETHYEAVVKHATEQLSTDSTDIIAKSTLAVAHARIGDLDEARVIADAVLAQNPQDFEVIRILALVALLDGKHRRAVDLLVRAHELGYPVSYLRRNPDLSELMDDPRMLALVDGE